MAQITLNPDPPEKGKPCKVCFTGTLPNTGRYRFRVGGSWQAWTNIEWTSANGGCVTVNVPANATDMQVEDPSGQAPVRDVPCV